MTYDIYARRFREKALNNGYSLDNIQKCLNYSKPILEKKLPVIYDINHLGSLVGYKSSYLKRAVISTKFFYKQYQIKKRNGSMRTISEPLPSLHEIQLWILEEILYKCKVSKYAKAYIPKKNLKEHLRYHTKEQEILTIDFCDFFSSISISTITSFFRELGYSKDVSNLLAGLCTHNDCLPQGASTSPYLSNLIMFIADENIANFSKQHKIKFSRYADDLAFSGNDLEVDNILNFVSSEIKPIGLRINTSKTKIMKRNARQIISGIIVNDKMQVPKENRNEIRNVMYYIQKFGIHSHMIKINETRENYIKHLLGKINYILTINPEDKEFKDYKFHLSELYKVESAR